MNWWTVLQIFLGAFFSACFVMWLECKRKPEISFKLYKSKTDPGRCGHDDDCWSNNYKTRVLRVDVENKNLFYLLRFMHRNPAIHCYGYVRFFKLNGEEIIRRTLFESEPHIPIKWANAPGRIPLPDGTKKEFPFIETKYRDIHTGEFEPIDVAVKYNDRQEFYGWSYDYTYFEDLINPNLKITEHECLVYIEINFAGERNGEIYKIINGSSNEKFRLVNACREQKKLVKKVIEREKKLKGGPLDSEAKSISTVLGD